MKRIIKFRRPYFRYSDNKFEYFDYWGVDIKIAKDVWVFRSPGSSNLHYGVDDQQFTGLFDKNGVEIYEGDLLRFPAKSKWEEINYSCYEIFFHGGDANSDYNIGFTMNRMHNHESVCGGYIPSFKPKTTAKMEIIGNIYENPELL